MGLSSSTSTVKPSAFAQPYVSGAANADQDTFNGNIGKIQNATNQVTGLLPGMVNQFQQGSPALNAQQNYITSTLGSNYAPTADFQNLMNYSDNQVANQTAGALGLHGLTNGSDMANIVSRNVAQNDAGLRQNDYNNFLSRQQTAAAMAPGNATANQNQINPLMSVLQGSLTPINASSGYSNSVAGLMSPYTTTTQNNGLLNSLIGAGATLGAAAIKASDARLKEDIREIDTTHNGLPLYLYRYKGDPTPQVGVMAQDVAQMQPDALGPVVGGYMTVDYGKVR